MRIPQASLAAELVGAFDRQGLSFMLVGAAALAVRGLARGTHGIDFLTTDRSVFRLDWPPLLSPDTRIEIRLGDADDPLAGVVRFAREGAADVDLVVARWKWQQQIIDRSEIVDLEDFSVRAPDAADLVLLKIEAGGFVDRNDAAQLIAIHGPELMDRISERLAALPRGMHEAWQRLREDMLRS